MAHQKEAALHLAGAGAWSEPYENAPTPLSLAALMFVHPKRRAVVASQTSNLAISRQHNNLQQHTYASGPVSQVEVTPFGCPTRVNDWLDDDINRFEEALAGLRSLPGRDRLKRVTEQADVNTAVEAPKMLTVSINLNVRAYSCLLHH